MRRVYLYAIATIFALVGCTSLEGDIEGNGQMDGIVFNLSYTKSEIRNNTKSGVGDNIDIAYLLCNASGYVIQDIKSEYRGELSQIVLEPLKIGSYTLYVLAYDKSMVEAGLVINSEIDDKGDKWFSFEGEQLTALKSSNLLYGYSQFYINDDTSKSIDVALSYLVSAVSIDKGVISPYLSRSINSFQLAPTAEHNLSSSFSVDGQFSEDKLLSLQPISVLQTQTLYFLPASANKQITFDIEVKTTSHDRIEGRMVHSFTAEVVSNYMNRVQMNLSKHPDYNVGTRWVTYGDIEAEGDNLPKILQDDEPKSIYYNKEERVFYINKPLQIGAIESENSITARLYSPVGMSDVTLWAQRYEGDEKIPIAYLDSIPAFADLEYTFDLKEGERLEMRGTSGKYLSLNAEQLGEYIHGEITIESGCEFWKKVQQIRADWKVTFASYGGDPDVPNGAPAGNWMGLRPVHAREGIAMLLNAAYMIALPDFAEELATYQGVILGNDGINPVDLSTVVPHMESLDHFNLGLIYTGNGVVGLGGGSTLGVSQSSYFNHYDALHPAETIFHEIGHCMGYSHSSGMSYGPWSEQLCNHFYNDNCYRFPVYSKSILDSANNPNAY